MLSLSKLADYATLLMAHLARDTVALHNAKALVAETGLTLPTVSKLLKCLVHAGLLQSRRGAQGGYALAVPAAQISLMHIIVAIEGVFALTTCSHGTGTCSLEESCRMRSNWRSINRAIVAALQQVTLMDLLEQPIATDNMQQALVQRLRHHPSNRVERVS